LSFLPEQLDFKKIRKPYGDFKKSKGNLASYLAKAVDDIDAITVVGVTNTVTRIGRQALVVHHARDLRIRIH
jgi:hypothetical protein